MFIIEMNNLYAGYNRTHDYKILILADDEFEAAQNASDFGKNAMMSGDWEILYLTDLKTKFDYSYVVTKENLKKGIISDNGSIFKQSNRN